MKSLENTISVILVVKNGAPYLAQAIESVLAQTVSPQEILLIDGHSHDATPQIAGRYSQVTRLLQTGHGLANARNQGISMVRGTWVAFLDGDDCWSVHKLALQMDFHRANPLADFSVAWVKFFLEPGAALRPGFRAETFETGEAGFTPGTLFARRSAFERVGCFDESLAIACDADWFSRLRDRGEKFGVLPQVLLHKRIHSNNLSRRVQQNQHELMVVLQRSLARKHQREQEDEAYVSETKR
jgi:glycosyltransferase involved in cell wall biosynthesis